MNKNKKYWKKRADRLFSLWVRQRDATDGIVTCVTCDTPHPWRSVHGGHFMSRRYESTRYHEDNCHGQCVRCNTFDQGKQYEHGIKIDEMILNDKSKTSAFTLTIFSKRTCKRGWLDYMIIADELLEKLKQTGFEIR